MLSQLLKGLMLGIGAAAPIGPVNVEMARRTLKGGFRAGFALGCGAVSVDVTYALLTSFGLAHLGDRPTLLLVIRLGGAILLTNLGLMSWIDAIKAWRRGDQEIDAATPISTLRNAYVSGLLMTFVNPMTLVFWFSSVSVASDAAHESGGLPIICMGVFFATLGWVAFFCSTLKWLRRWRRQWWMTAADALGGSMLLGFASYAFWTSGRAFL